MGGRLGRGVPLGDLPGMDLSTEVAPGTSVPSHRSRVLPSAQHVH